MNWHLIEGYLSTRSIFSCVKIQLRVDVTIADYVFRKRPPTKAARDSPVSPIMDFPFLTRETRQISYFDEKVETFIAEYHWLSNYSPVSAFPVLLRKVNVPQGNKTPRRIVSHSIAYCQQFVELTFRALSGFKTFLTTENATLRSSKRTQKLASQLPWSYCMRWWLTQMNFYSHNNTNKSQMPFFFFIHWTDKHVDVTPAI